MSYFKSPLRQRGSGMMEVMVSVLLLGIAVIGFAALQVRAVAVTGESSYRTQAMGIAQAFAEKVRANYAQLGTYSNASNWTTGTVPNCLTVACSSTDLATYDIQTTLADTAAMLPGGTIKAQPCNGSTAMCIYVAWNKTTAGAGGTTDCVNSSGTYSSSSADCVMMEVYL